MLELENGKECISESFYYEDYELNTTKLSVRVESQVQYRNKPLKVYVKGTDENDLNLMDARIDVLVKPRNINKFFDRYSFIPDTLLFIQKKLNPTQETEIVIHDSLFAKVNFEYDITISMYTSDNEKKLETKTIKYYYENKEFNSKLENDSIRFSYSVNGLSTNTNAIISAVDNFKNSKIVYEGEIPNSLPINNYFSNYSIVSGSVSKKIDISSEPSLLQCFSDRTKDSLFIDVSNPRKVLFKYDIFKANNRILSGFWQFPES